MKKIFIMMIFVLSSICTWAQNDKSEHLEFKGVPINGKLGDYILKMENNGFSIIGNVEGESMLIGDFAGYKDCKIIVSTLKQTDLVNKISVAFHECDTWSAISNNYYTLKELLSEKYGKPSKVVEEFQTYSEPKSDRYRMQEVTMGNCKYYSIFETEKGKIILSINGSVTSSFVMLTYYDKINSDIIRSKALEDL